MFIKGLIQIDTLISLNMHLDIYTSQSLHRGSYDLNITLIKHQMAPRGCCSKYYVYQAITSAMACMQHHAHVAAEQMVECSTTVDCSSNSALMSARECCVNSVDGLSYSIPGQQQCHTCIGEPEIVLSLLNFRIYRIAGKFGGLAV